MTTWIYNFSVYDNESAALDAVTALKNELDNLPTTYVEVKLLSGNAVDGWVVPTEKLTDKQAKQRKRREESLSQAAATLGQLGSSYSARSRACRTGPARLDP